MIRKLILPLLSFALPVVAGAQAFGPASGYNVFLSGGFTAPSSDVEGKVAVGGDFSVGSYSVGALLTGTQDALIAGGHVTVNGGSVTGNIVASGGATLNNFGFYNGGTLITGPSAVSSRIDFSATAQYLQNASSQWGALGTTGTIVSQYGGITFTGTNANLNVFTLSAADLWAGTYYNFNVPSTSTVLFNITGDTGGGALSLRNTGYNGLTNTKTIWNIVDATTVNVNYIEGTLLAPKANIVGNGGGVIQGGVYGKSWTGNVQINQRLFSNGGGDDHLPYVTNAVPEPTSLLAFGLAGGALIRRRSRRK